MKKYILALLLPACSALASGGAGVEPPNPLVNVHSIAGKERGDVDTLLGAPAACENLQRYGYKCTYTKFELEIVFINEKADWITYNALQGIKYSPEGLKALGLEFQEPTNQTPDAIQWRSIPGFKLVSFFPKGGSDDTDYIYVKVTTD